MSELRGWCLDFANALASALEGRGPTEDDLTGVLEGRFAAAWKAREHQRGQGLLGFIDLPEQRGALHEVQQLADGFGQRFDAVVVIGIGGSALGGLAMRDALLGPFWNERTPQARQHFPRLYFLDNPDPSLLTDVLGVVDPSRTLFNVISKSGSTAETMALYLVVRGMLDKSLGADVAPAHFVFTTDPTSGPLRALGDAQGIPLLAIPRNVGGRFSVLSPVGLLPAAMTGLDIRALLDGAAAMNAQCERDTLRENPAALLACLLHAWDVDHGTPIHVMMPYAQRLRSFALWFQQLWAESLGKQRAGVGVGPTPLPAVGATDQHAQVQLFMEGPLDKLILFMSVGDMPEKVDIPSVHDGVEAAEYLAGHTLAELLDVERRATTEALRQRGRPSCTLTIPVLDARALGGLFQLFEHATVLAGGLYDVDPLDQPGVELGKRLTYGLLGRTGHPIDPLPGEDASRQWRA